MKNYPAKIVLEIPEVKIVPMFNDGDPDLYTCDEKSRVLKLMKIHTLSKVNELPLNCYIGRPSIKIPDSKYLFVTRDQYIEDFKLN